MRSRITIAATAVALVAAGPVFAAKTMSVATNPQGSAYYAVGSAVSKVATQSDAARLLVQPTSGSSENVALLEQDDVEFAVLNTVELAWAREGAANYNGRKHENLRLVSAMFQFPIGIAVRADSDIESLADLKGKKMPTGYASHLTIRYIQDAILAVGDLTTDDIKPLPVANYVQGMQALADGRADAAVVGPTSGKAREIDSQLTGSGGIRFLPIPETDAALKAMRGVFPGSQHYLLSSDRGLPGVDEEINVMAWSGFLATNADVPEEVVYSVTRSLAEHPDELAASTPTLKEFTPAIMREEHPVPYHAGAKRYYQENGMWQ